MMAESFCTTAARKLDGELLWMKDSMSGIWYPVERLREEELTEQMKFQRNQALISMANSSKNNQDIENIRNESNDSAYVVKYVTADEFTVLGKNDVVLKEVDDAKTLGLVYESICIMRSKNSEEDRANLANRLRVYAKGVISVVPLPVELKSLFEREILDPPMMKSSSTSSSAVPTKMLHCHYCPFTASRDGVISSHTKHCSGKKRVHSSSILRVLLRTSPAAPTKITHCQYCPFRASRSGVIMSHMKHCPLKPRLFRSSDLLNSKSTTSTPQQELERHIDAHATPEHVEVRLALNQNQEIVEPPVSPNTMPVYDSMNLSSVEMDCNPTPPEHEVKLEESKEEVSPAVIDNQVVHMEPMEVEDESNETMIVLLENVSEQPNHAYEHGENNLGSVVLEMIKVAEPETNERLVFQNPLEGEADFLEEPAEDPSRHGPEFLQRPPTPDNGASTAPPTVHVHHELGAQVVPEEMQAGTSATVEERKVHFYVDAFTGIVYYVDGISQDVRDAIVNAEVCYMD